MPARRSIWRARRSRAALSRLTGCWISTGTSAIDGAAITIAGTTGELEATAGTLTIDGGSISNNRELLATGRHHARARWLTVSNTGNGTVEVDATEAVVSTLDLESATISGGIVNVYGLLDFDRHQRHRRCGHHHHRNARSDQWHADHRSQHDQQQRRAVGDGRQHRRARWCNRQQYRRRHRRGRCDRSGCFHA